MTGRSPIGRYDERTIRSLRDIVRHCEVAARLVARGRTAYDSDEMLRHAAEAILIRAGEGVDRIDKAGSGLVEDHPDLELRVLKDARNFVAHAYDLVSPDIVWEIMEQNLPEVARRITRFLDD